MKRHLNTLFGGDGNNRGILIGAFWRFSCSGSPPASTSSSLASRAWCCASANSTVSPHPDCAITCPLRLRAWRSSIPRPCAWKRWAATTARLRTAAATGTGDDEILMLTGDENIINVSFSVQWKVSDAQAFAFNIPEPQRETVRAVTESAMREVIGRTTLESALTVGKSKVAAEATKLTQQTLDNYKTGIEILEVNLLDASFPQAVVDAARDVQAAQADQESARNEAEGYTNDILPRARGQAERMVQEAEAYKQQVVAQAQGSTARLLSVYDQYKQAEDVTRKRIYLETMEKILEGTNKVIMDSKHRRRALPAAAGAETLIRRHRQGRAVMQRAYEPYRGLRCGAAAGGL